MANTADRSAIDALAAARGPARRRGTRDAATRPMLRMKDTNKLIKNVLRALPALPFFAPKKTSIAPFVLGAIGAAVIGGIAAVMIFSPRVRYRALDVAKDGYGKVKGQIDQLGLAEKLGMSQEAGERATSPEQRNGLSENYSSGV